MRCAVSENSIAQAWVTGRRKACTVTRYWHLTPSIIDLQFVGANAAAMKVYGVDTPGDIIGHFISEFLHPDDQRRGSLQAAVRLTGTPRKCTPYPVRVTRPGGEEVYMLKSAEHRFVQEYGLIWLSEFEQIGAVDIPAMPTAEALGLTQDSVNGFVLPMTVRESEILYGSGERLLSCYPATVPVQIGRASNPVTTKANIGYNHMLPDSIQAFKDNPTQRTYAYAERSEKQEVTCQRCAHSWRPRVPYPVRCAKCASKGWDTPYARGKYAARAG